MELCDMASKKALFVGADAKYMAEFRLPLMNELAAQGFRVIVLATEIRPGDGRYVTGAGYEFVSWTLRKVTANPLGDLGAIFQLSSLLRGGDFDLVFAHTIKPVIYALPLAKIAGVHRRVAMIPGLGYAFTQGQSLKRRLITMIATVAYKVAFKASTVVLLQNPDDEKELRSRGALGPEVSVKLVDGSGVDMSRFVPAAEPEGPIRFLMVARLIADKGVREFVAASRIVRRVLPDVEFVLVGAPDANPNAIMREEIDGWIAEGIVEVKGHVERPESEYASTHVFVLPSYYPEGTPRTNLEAMASGRPVITTDMPGCRETVVQGVSGLLVPPRDVDALADAILALGGDAALRTDMGRAALRICEDRYELGKVARDTVAKMLS